MYGNGYQINRVAISGSNGPRASLFAPATKEIFGLGGTMGFNPVLAAIALGQTAQESYENGLREISRFDALVARVARLGIGTPGKEYRDNLIKTYGLNEPTNKDKAMYMRNATASCIAEADKYQPIAYEQGFPGRGPCRGRVTKLHNWNSDLAADVTYGEDNYGINPEPVIIERTITVPGEAAAATSPWPYVVVGAGVVAALAIAGII